MGCMWRVVCACVCMCADARGVCMCADARDVCACVRVVLVPQPQVVLIMSLMLMNVSIPRLFVLYFNSIVSVLYLYCICRTFHVGLHMGLHVHVRVHGAWAIHRPSAYPDCNLHLLRAGPDPIRSDLR